ncbi:PEP-CTERM sorting domain-containing protein [Aeoliella sp. SH292]|uniref:PEP-CTERM sorting domain-containing protein n=1 Tax=Aeoliella sp. SH292 TaxID=3454464 RepID=UPI003F94CAA4
MNFLRSSFKATLVLLALAIVQGAIAAPITGDLNGDGSVNLMDYVTWSDAGGTSGELDGWRAAYGSPSPATLHSDDASIMSVGPTASAIGIENGSIIEWIAYFTPDPSLYFDPPADNPDRGVGTSMGVGFNYEVAAGTLIPSSVMLLSPFDFDPMFPGSDPYTGSVVEGIQLHASTASVMGGGVVDAIFLPAGSEWITAFGPATAIKFSTTAGGRELTFGGVVAQSQLPNEIILAPQTAQAVPEPSALLLIGLLVGCALMGHARRT